MTEWKIQSRALACQGCGQEFADKAAYYTLLFDKRDSLDRLDVCPTCWENQYSQGAADRKGFVSFWQGVFSVPPPPPPEPIQKESAESLLRKLVESNDPNHQSACFILAVMLERKRVFKVKTQSVEGGRRVLCYEQARTGDLFTIVDPGLQLAQLATVQQRVADLLEHGLGPGPEQPVTEQAPTMGPEEPPAEAGDAGTAPPEQMLLPQPVTEAPADSGAEPNPPAEEPASPTEAPANG